MDNMQSVKGTSARPVSEKELRGIAHDSVRQWKKLGLLLGFTWNELSVFEYRHRDFVEEAIFEMLVSWNNSYRGINRRQDLNHACKMMTSTTDLVPWRTGDVAAELFLYQVGENIGPSWKSVGGTLLGITQAQLDTIENDNARNGVYAAMDVLVKWRTNHESQGHDNSQMVKDLVKAADGCHCLDLVKKLNKNIARHSFRIEPQNVKGLQDEERHILGSGGFAEVIQASYLSQTVAVKILYSERRLPNDVIDEMMREVDKMREIHHPNTVPLMGIIVDNDSRMFGLVMEYMEHGSLKDFMDEEETLTWPFKNHIVVDICRAMAYLHSINIVHRDLKSSNVLIDDNLKAKVSDFGLSQSCGLWTTMSIKSSTPTEGTVTHMAPEALDPPKNDCTAKKESDVWSMGILLFEIGAEKKRDSTSLHKRVPFPDGIKRESILIQIGFKKESPLTKEQIEEKIAEDCPSHFLDLMKECLQVDQNARPTFHELLEKFQETSESDEYMGYLKRKEDVKQSFIRRSAHYENESETLYGGAPSTSKHGYPAESYSYTRCAAEAQVQTSPIEYKTTHEHYTYATGQNSEEDIPIYVEPSSHIEGNEDSYSCTEKLNSEDFDNPVGIPSKDTDDAYMPSFSPVTPKSSRPTSLPLDYTGPVIPPVPPPLRKITTNNNESEPYSYAKSEKDMALGIKWKDDESYSYAALPEELAMSTNKTEFYAYAKKTFPEIPPVSSRYVYSGSNTNTTKQPKIQEQDFESVGNLSQQKEDTIKQDLEYSKNPSTIYSGPLQPAPPPPPPPRNKSAVYKNVQDKQSDTGATYITMKGNRPHSSNVYSEFPSSKTDKDFYQTDEEIYAVIDDLHIDQASQVFENTQSKTSLNSGYISDPTKPSALPHRPRQIGYPEVEGVTILSNDPSVAVVNITLLRQGDFGKIYEAELKHGGETQTVSLRQHDDEKSLMREAETLIKLAHTNIEELVGVCLKHKQLVTKFLPYNLLQLLGQDKGRSITMTQLVRMTSEILAALCFIDKQKYVHRAVRASSVLLSESHSCRLSGFTRAVYVGDKPGGVLVSRRGVDVSEIHWSAPETMKRDGCEYSTKSDVWAFGVTLHEIFTYGTSVPTGKKSKQMDQLIRRLHTDKKTTTSDIQDVPEFIEHIISLKEACCHTRSELRPSFETVRSSFKLTTQKLSISDSDVYKKQEKASTEHTPSSPIWL